MTAVWIGVIVVVVWLVVAVRVALRVGGGLRRGDEAAGITQARQDAQQAAWLRSVAERRARRRLVRTRVTVHLRFRPPRKEASDAQPQHGRQLMTAPDPRDVDLVDRARSYGDELDTSELDRSRARLAVVVLGLAAAALLVTIWVVAMQKGSQPLVPNPDGRPAFSYRSADNPQLPAVLRVHGHSALVAS